MNPSIVVVGASLGGLSALRVILGRLPPGYPFPVAVAQHRKPFPATNGDDLASVLSRYGPLPVIDAEDKAPVDPGRIVLAPPDYHLLVEQRHFALSTGESVSYARPSIDVLFESAAEAYGAAVVAVLLTGANRDGAEGVLAVQRAGGRVLIQDPLDAEAPAMPRAGLEALGLDKGLRLTEIADELAHLRLSGRGVVVNDRRRSREDLDRRR